MLRGVVLQADGDVVLLHPSVYLEEISEYLRRSHQLTIPVLCEAFPACVQHFPQFVAAYYLGETAVVRRYKSLQTLCEELHIHRVMGLGIGTFLPPQHILREYSRHRMADKPLFPALIGFHLPWDVIGILHYPVIAEGNSNLQTICHAHAVLTVMPCNKGKAALLSQKVDVKLIICKGYFVYKNTGYILLFIKVKRAPIVNVWQYGIRLYGVCCICI